MFKPWSKVIKNIIIIRIIIKKKQKQGKKKSW